MPLHVHDEPAVLVLEGLHHAVVGASDHPQPVAQVVDSLMVHAVGPPVRTHDGTELGAGCDPNRVDAVRPSLQVPVLTMVRIMLAMSWTRVPPSATFTTCDPLQTPRSGRSWSTA